MDEATLRAEQAKLDEEKRAVAADKAKAEEAAAAATADAEKLEGERKAFHMQRAERYWDQILAAGRAAPGEKEVFLAGAEDAYGNTRVMAFARHDGAEGPGDALDRHADNYMRRPTVGKRTKAAPSPGADGAADEDVQDRYYSAICEVAEKETEGDMGEAAKLVEQRMGREAFARYRKDTFRTVTGTPASDDEEGGEA